jgi:hypothetical protein
LRCTKELNARWTYLTINPCQPQLLNRAINHLREYGKKETTADNNILRRRWIPLDFDPVRAGSVNGIPSTDEEHAAVFAKARKLRDFLTSQGFTAPVLVDSGNGAYLLYAVDLPNDKDSTDLVKSLIENLDQLYGDSRVSIDTTMYNAARIICLAGTMNRKGDHAPERPWRWARIVEAPHKVQIVPREALDRLAQLFPKPDSNRSHANNQTSAARFDLDNFIQQHGIAVRRAKPWHGSGRMLILEHCVFDETHTGTAAAILQFPSGALDYRCQHRSCHDKRWRELRERFEPGYQQQRQNAQSTEFRVGSDGTNPPRRTRSSGVMAKDVQPRRLHWLWRGRFPRGMFCGIEGDPGEGKSLVCADLALSNRPYSNNSMASSPRNEAWSWCAGGIPR